MLGFLQADTPAGSYGPVSTLGIGWALYSSAASKVGAQNNNPPAASDFVVPATPGVSILGTVGAFLSSSGPSSCIFGMWLDIDNPAASGPLVKRRAMIYGPKLVNGI